MLKVAKDFVKYLKENMEESRAQISNFIYSKYRIKYFKAWKAAYLYLQESQIKNNFDQFLKSRYLKV